MTEGETQESNQEVVNESNEGESASTSSEAAVQQLVEIDSLEKFKFGGREWTPKELLGAYMMQSDYTRKTQALSQERKYYDNLSADLEKVRNNPALAEQFKSVYPKKFHSYLGYVSNAQQSQGQNQAKPPGVDQEEWNKIKSQVETFSTHLNQQKVQSASSAIDAAFAKFAPKYDLASEDSVINAAESLIAQKKADMEAQGNDPTDVSISEKEWEGIFKSVHDRNHKTYSQWQSKRVNKQTQLNKAGSDIGSGGGTPGAPARTPKNIDEALKDYLATGA